MLSTAQTPLKTSGPTPGRTPIRESGSTGAEDTTRELIKNSEHRLGLSNLPGSESGAVPTFTLGAGEFLENPYTEALGPHRWLFVTAQVFRKDRRARPSQRRSKALPLAAKEPANSSHSSSSVQLAEDASARRPSM